LNRLPGSVERSSLATDVDSSGSDPCSPDDEDCDVIFSGSGGAEEIFETTTMKNERKEQNVKGAPLDAGKHEGLGDNENIDRVPTGTERVQTKDMVVKQSTEGIVYIQSTPANASPTRIGFRTTTDVPLKSRITPKLSENGFEKKIVTISTTLDLFITQNMTTDPLTTRWRRTTVETATDRGQNSLGVKIKGPDSGSNQGRDASGDGHENGVSTYPIIGSREHMTRLTLNIGLIVGVAGGLALLLLVLAFAVYKYRGAGVRGVRRKTGSPTPPCIKGYVYESCNTLQPSSPPLVTAHYMTLPPSNSVNYATADPLPTACLTTGRRKDVKEWYV